ncbi:MAG: hypothetical protein DRI44_03680 [Chlamydiae bacterium]|nr:MAG: hypothetical protein DRI44_03680 [Chlamydiota bacterium]
MKKPILKAISRGVLSLLLLSQLAVAQSPIDAALKQKAKLLSPKLAEQIALQREEMRAESEEITTQAITAMNQGEYKKAYHYLTEALNKNPVNLTAKAKLMKVNSILFDVYVKYAQSRMAIKDYESAIKWYREALIHKPKNKAAIKGVLLARERISESVSKNIGKIISDSMTNDEKVKLLMKQARDLEVQSRYEEAKAVYKKAIKIVPSNPQPRRFLKELIEKQGRMIADDRRIERRQIMEDLIKSFFHHPEEYVEATTAKGAEELTPEMKRRAEIIKKANLKLENLSFKDAQVQEVLNYIAEVAGLSIIVNLGNAKEDTTSIELYNPTALQAIQYVCEQQGLTYTIDQYAIVISKGEGEMETRFWTVSARALSTAEEKATTSEDSSEIDLFSDDSTDSSSGDEFESASVEPEIVRMIKNSVPNWPDGSTIFLEPSTGTLVVRQTPGILDEIDGFIKELGTDEEQLQVEIQTRFVLITDQNLEELSIGMALKSPFDLYTRGKNRAGVSRGGVINPTDLTGALRRYSAKRRNSRYSDTLKNAINMLGLKEGNNQVSDQVIGFFTSALTSPEVGLIFHGISNQTDTDMLSAPKITTVSGQSRVSIRQITEVMYPDEYTVYKPAIIYFTGSGGGGIFGSFSMSAVAGTYPGYATVESTLKEDVGIQLVVSPTIGENGKTVSMEVTAQVSEEIEPHLVTVYVGNDNIIPPIEPITLSVPRFKTSEVKTHVVVNDGETIVLGGMIMEQLKKYNDKVPFWGDLPLVGRLFRSEGSFQDKRNLLIFVTTNIVTPGGKSYKELREKQLKKQAEKAETEEQQQADGGSNADETVTSS